MTIDVKLSRKNRLERFNINELIWEKVEKVDTKILNDGHLRLVDFTGDDLLPARVARIAYSNSARSKALRDACGNNPRVVKKRSDADLIRFLLSHSHTSPFEFLSMTFDMKLPIFVARQFVRHRVASLNEISARYSELDLGYYIPAPERLCEQSKTNKQGSGRNVPKNVSEGLLRAWKDTTDFAISRYKNEVKPVDEGGLGLARELCRINLPLSAYTQWIWQMKLGNLFHFLNLRADSHAQIEAQKYAYKILEYVEIVYPVCYQAFMDYQKQARRLSSMELDCLKACFRLENGVKTFLSSDYDKKAFFEFVSPRMTKRERGAFVALVANLCESK